MIKTKTLALLGITDENQKGRKLNWNSLEHPQDRKPEKIRVSNLVLIRCNVHNKIVFFYFNKASSRNFSEM